MIKPNQSQKASFPPLLRLTYLLQHKSDEVLLNKVGVSLSQTNIMSGLSTTTSISQTQLAAMLHQSESNISRQLNIMKSRGLVNVAKSKQDHRSREVKLTANGMRRYISAQAVLKSQLSKLQRLDSANDKKVSQQVIANLLTALNQEATTRRRLAR